MSRTKKDSRFAPKLCAGVELQVILDSESESETDSVLASDSCSVGSAP
jgi:hypothetical protein